MQYWQVIVGKPASPAFTDLRFTFKEHAMAWAWANYRKGNPVEIIEWNGEVEGECIKMLIA